MGAEATSSIGGVWARLEGQVVDDQFPLRRFLGSSEHSGVFLTEAAKLAPSDVALKLVSIASSARAESQLARWYAVAGGVSHPHLVRLFDVGRCNVAGLGDLYAVMEYADQDLAQLLQRRALTEEETREMLVPALSALAFLHERKLVMGRLKPSNILVVGDQLKLASDAIRAVGEVDDVRTLSAYDPPEARDGSCSPAGDVWALGVTLCEALTRRQPLGLMSGAGMVVLPPDLPPAFREIVAWCLRRQPQDRPEIAEIDAWLSGQPVTVVTEDSAAGEVSASEFSAGELLANELLASGPAASAPGASDRAAGEPSAAAPAAERSAGTEPPHASAARASATLASAAPVPNAPMSATTVDVELAAGLESPPSKPAPVAPAVTVAPKSAPATPPPAASASVKPASAAASTMQSAPARPAQEFAAPTSGPAAPSRAVSAPESARAAPGRAPDAATVPPNRTPPAAALAPSPALEGSPSAPSRAPISAMSPPSRAPERAPSAPGRAPVSGMSPPSRAPERAPSAPSRAPVSGMSPPGRAPEGSPSTPSRAPGASVQTPGRAPAAATPPSARAPAPPAAKAAVAPSTAADTASKWRPVESPTPREARRAERASENAAPPPRRSLLVPALGVVLVIGVVWAGIRIFSTKPLPEAATDTVSESRLETSDAEQSAVPPESTELPAPTGSGSQRQANSSAGTGGRSNAKAPANAKAPIRAMASAGNGASTKSMPATAVPGGSTVAVQEVLPDIPQRSRRTIRGHVRVSVRVIVEQDGTVFAALAEQRGPSRYFERLAVDAAKKWTFTPADGDAQRLMLVKFDFTRDGATADAVPLK